MSLNNLNENSTMGNASTADEPKATKQTQKMEPTSENTGSMQGKGRTSKIHKKTSKKKSTPTKALILNMGPQDNQASSSVSGFEWLSSCELVNSDENNVPEIPMNEGEQNELGHLVKRSHSCKEQSEGGSLNMKNHPAIPKNDSPDLRGSSIEMLSSSGHHQNGANESRGSAKKGKVDSELRMHESGSSNSENLESVGVAIKGSSRSTNRQYYESHINDVTFSEAISASTPVLPKEKRKLHITCTQPSKSLAKEIPSSSQKKTGLRGANSKAKRSSNSQVADEYNLIKRRKHKPKASIDQISNDEQKTNGIKIEPEQTSQVPSERTPMALNFSDPKHVVSKRIAPINDKHSMEDFYDQLVEDMKNSTKETRKLQIPYPVEGSKTVNKQKRTPKDRPIKSKKQEDRAIPTAGSLDMMNGHQLSRGESGSNRNVDHLNYINYGKMENDDENRECLEDSVGLSLRGGPRVLEFSANWNRGNEKPHDKDDRSFYFSDDSSSSLVLDYDEIPKPEEDTDYEEGRYKHQGEVQTNPDERYGLSSQHVETSSSSDDEFLSYQRLLSVQYEPPTQVPDFPGTTCGNGNARELHLKSNFRHSLRASTATDLNASHKSVRRSTTDDLGVTPNSSKPNNNEKWNSNNFSPSVNSHFRLPTRGRQLVSSREESTENTGRRNMVYSVNQFVPDTSSVRGNNSRGRSSDRTTMDPKIQHSSFEESVDDWSEYYVNWDQPTYFDNENSHGILDRSAPVIENVFERIDYLYETVKKINVPPSILKKQPLIENQIKIKAKTVKMFDDISTALPLTPGTMKLIEHSLCPKLWTGGQCEGNCKKMHKVKCDGIFSVSVDEVFRALKTRFIQLDNPNVHMVVSFIESLAEIQEVDKILSFSEILFSMKPLSSCKFFGSAFVKTISGCLQLENWMAAEYLLKYHYVLKCGDLIGLKLAMNKLFVFLHVGTYKYKVYRVVRFLLDVEGYDLPVAILDKLLHEVTLNAPSDISETKEKIKKQLDLLNNYDDLNFRARASQFLRLYFSKQPATRS